MPAKELIDIAAALEHETDAAYLINDGTEKVWVPKSQVEYDEDEGVFKMPEWLALKCGLI